MKKEINKYDNFKYFILTSIFIIAFYLSIPTLMDILGNNILSQIVIGVIGLMAFIFFIERIFTKK
jgi:hypothetical protein